LLDDIAKEDELHRSKLVGKKKPLKKVASNQRGKSRNGNFFIHQGCFIKTYYYYLESDKTKEESADVYLEYTNTLLSHVMFKYVPSFAHAHCAHYHAHYSHIHLTPSHLIHASNEVQSK
jgi:hypothetical protein